MAGLLPHQCVSALWLAERHRALLADEMRVGKTGSSIVAAGLVGAKTILVLCPAIARLNWVAEIQRFAGRASSAMLKKGDSTHPEITVCSYDIVADPKVYPKIAKQYDVVILDESHYLKNAESKRTQAAFGIANGAKYAWALSGTPAPKDNGDLFPLLSNFGVTPADYWSFVYQYCIVKKDAYKEYIVGSRNERDLAKLLNGFMLRRTLREVAPNMPKARWTTHLVEAGPIPKGSMTPEEMALANKEMLALDSRLTEAREQLDELDPEASRNYRRLVGLQKVTQVSHLIDDELATTDRKLVVFGWHRDVLMALHQALKKYDARLILGSTDDAYKEAAKKDFRESGSCRVVVANIVAAGTAIDLSSADDALFIEEDWTPGNNLQAAMRVVSQFKSRPVLIRSVVISGTVDERVQQVLQRRLSGTSTIFSYTVAPHASLL